MPWRKQERRSEPRKAADMWVELTRGDETYLQRASNISLEGMYFDQTVPLPLGTQVLLKMTLPSLEEAFECQGEIVAVKALGMGVHFVNLSVNASGVLRHLLASL